LIIFVDKGPVSCYKLNHKLDKAKRTVRGGRKEPELMLFKTAGLPKDEQNLWYVRLFNWGNLGNEREANISLNQRGLI